jgi:hypothetical protein
MIKKSIVTLIGMAQMRQMKMLIFQKKNILTYQNIFTVPQLQHWDYLKIFFSGQKYK